jgi:hypothetical protein
VRCVFEFISNFGGAAVDADALQMKLDELIAAEAERPEGDDADNDVNDAVFAQSFIPRSLAEVAAPPHHPPRAFALNSKDVGLICCDTRWRMWSGM